VFGPLLALLLGSMVCLVALELSLRLAGACFLYRQRAESAEGGGAGSASILCLGESSTALGGADSYPRQLERILDEQAGDGRFEVINGARPGIDSSGVLRSLGEQLERYEPDIVTVMMGVNDELEWFVELNDGHDDSALRSSLEGLGIYRLACYGSRVLERRATARAEAAELEELERVWERGLPSRARARVGHRLAKLYSQQRRLDDRVAVLETLVELRTSPQAHVELSRLIEDPAHKEATLLACIRDFPDSHLGYRWLVRWYGEQGRADDIEALLSEQVRTIPDLMSLVELARFYRASGQLDRAEAVLLRSNELEPNFYTMRLLALVMRDMGGDELAEQLLLESNAMLPCALTHVELGRLYVAMGRPDEAERAYRSAIDLDDGICPDRHYTWDSNTVDISCAWVELAQLLRESGRSGQAQQLLQGLHSNPLTVTSYRELSRTVLARGALLVAVQYPLRDVEPLRSMLPDHPGVLFVDNRASFIRAVSEQGYSALFIDHYAGDFGHTTALGHELIARNIAEVLLASLEADTTGVATTARADSPHQLNPSNADP
jgi:tetratricopeptide (TPR) repeat protein